MKSVVVTGDVTPLHVEHHAGKEISVYFSCESFQRSDPIRVSSEEKNYVQPIRLYDQFDRVLFLRAFIKYRSGTILVIIACTYSLDVHTHGSIQIRKVLKNFSIRGPVS